MLARRDPAPGTGAAARRRAADAARQRIRKNHAPGIADPEAFSRAVECWDRAWTGVVSGGDAYRLTKTSPPTPPPPTRVVVGGGVGVLGAVAVVLRVALAVGLAWLVLVVLRRPADVLDEPLDDSLLADRAMTVAAWVANVGTTLVLGGLAYRSFVRDVATSRDGQRDDRVLCIVALAGGAAALATLPLRAVALSGAWQAGVRDPSTLGFVASSPFGDSALLRTAGLTLVAAAVWRPGRPASERVACGLGAAAILASFSLVGHPQSTGGRFSPLVLSQAVHVLAVAVWFGGVTFLTLDLRRRHRAGDPRGVAAVVRRFSTLATLAVVAATATGTALAWSQIGEPRALWETAYGRAFLAKLGCVAIVVAAGGYNREVLVPQLRRADREAVWRRLRRTLTLEMLVMGLGVLLATALMTSGGL